MKTKAIAAGILAISLAGCGQIENSADPPQSAPAPPTGIYVDSTADQWLRDKFAETKACVGLPEGEYDSLTIVMMPPSFPCPHYPDGCNGEFVMPSTIKMGSAWIYRHEVIHYILWLNTGDADPGHKNVLFLTCGF